VQATQDFDDYNMNITLPEHIAELESRLYYTIDWPYPINHEWWNNSRLALSRSIATTEQLLHAFERRTWTGPREKPRLWEVGGVLNDDEWSIMDDGFDQFTLVHDTWDTSSNRRIVIAKQIANYCNPCTLRLFYPDSRQLEFWSRVRIEPDYVPFHDEIFKGTNMEELVFVGNINVLCSAYVHAGPNNNIKALSFISTEGSARPVFDPSELLSVRLACINTPGLLFLYLDGFVLDQENINGLVYALDHCPNLEKFCLRHCKMVSNESKVYSHLLRRHPNLHTIGIADTNENSVLPDCYRMCMVEKLKPYLTYPGQDNRSLVDLKFPCSDYSSLPYMITQFYKTLTLLSMTAVITTPSLLLNGELHMTRTQDTKTTCLTIHSSEGTIYKQRGWPHHAVGRPARRNAWDGTRYKGSAYIAGVGGSRHQISIAIPATVYINFLLKTVFCASIGFRWWAESTNVVVLDQDCDNGVEDTRHHNVDIDGFFKKTFDPSTGEADASFHDIDNLYASDELDNEELDKMCGEIMHKAKSIHWSRNLMIPRQDSFQFIQPAAMADFSCEPHLLKVMQQIVETGAIDQVPIELIFSHLSIGEMSDFGVTQLFQQFPKYKNKLDLTISCGRLTRTIPPTVTTNLKIRLLRVTANTHCWNALDLVLRTQKEWLEELIVITTVNFWQGVEPTFCIAVETQLREMKCLLRIFLSANGPFGIEPIFLSVPHRNMFTASFIHKRLIFIAACINGVSTNSTKVQIKLPILDACGRYTAPAPIEDIASHDSFRSFFLMAIGRVRSCFFIDIPLVAIKTQGIEDILDLLCQGESTVSRICDFGNLDDLEEAPEIGQQYTEIGEDGYGHLLTRLVCNRQLERMMYVLAKGPEGKAACIAHTLTSLLRKKRKDRGEFMYAYFFY
jgi:hypothetical protein